MRIGVICEGPTDYPAIVHFFGGALEAGGINAAFKSLYPQLDKTRPEGGWANVLLWLSRHGPPERIRRFFAGGLFDNPLKSETFDALLIQLDIDILDEKSFRDYVARKYDYAVKTTQNPEDRAKQVSQILYIASGMDKLCEVDALRHVLCPVVEATEAWCVAVFQPQRLDVEVLSGEALTNAFMKALEQSEGSLPKESYTNCNKDTKRREKFCAGHRQFSQRIVQSAPNFALPLKRLENLDSLTKSTGL